MNTPEQPLNPPEAGREYTAQQIEDAREGALNELLTYDFALMNLENEEFDLVESRQLFWLLSQIMTDKRENQQDHIDDMKELFKSKLSDKATAMAMQYLSEQRD